MSVKTLGKSASQEGSFQQFPGKAGFSVPTMNLFRHSWKLSIKTCGRVKCLQEFWNEIKSLWGLENKKWLRHCSIDFLPLVSHHWVNKLFLEVLYKLLNKVTSNVSGKCSLLWFQVHMADYSRKRYGRKDLVSHGIQLSYFKGMSDGRQGDWELDLGSQRLELRARAALHCLHIEGG